MREALANRDRAEQDLENTQRSVAQAVRVNFLNVTSGIAQVRALEQALASTQSQLDSTILGRDVGVRTSVDVLNAQQQVFQTRRDLQQARYNYPAEHAAPEGRRRHLERVRRGRGQPHARARLAFRGGGLDPVDQALDRAAMRGDEFARLPAHLLAA